MNNVAAANPPIPPFLRVVTIIECLVVFAAATVLFFLPNLGQDIWAWSAPPFNSRYIGAIYFAAFAPLAALAITGRWVPGRLVLWMIFTFTTSIMVAMFIHYADFVWTRWATYAFWFLYIFLPINSALFLYRLRALNVDDANPTMPVLHFALLATTIVLTLYGLALFVAPTTATAFWPWPVDAFHGRIYTATFITPAVGAWLIYKKAAPFEIFVLGMTLLCLGAFSIAGVLLTNATVPVARQVDFTSLGAWLFFFINAVTIVVGGWFMLIAHASRPEHSP